MQKRDYDFIIVGSGATGGLLAYELSRRGAEILMLEGGPHLSPAQAFRTHQWPYEFRHRDLKSFFTTASERVGHLWADGSKEPFTTPSGQSFHFPRVRAVGGKTLLWAGYSYRMSPLDFENRGSLGQPEWPLSYEDLAPYYDRIEETIGVCGSQENLIDVPDGKFLPPLKLRCCEMILKLATNRIGIRAITARKDALTRDHRGSPACHWCGHCSWGCDSQSKFSTLWTYIPWAIETGRCTLQSDAFATEILVDDEGLCKGVRYARRHTQDFREAYGKSVVVCGGSVESARLLLLSKSTYHPNGLANNSDQVGRNLMEHIQSSVSGYMNALRDLPVMNEDGAGGGHLFLPRVNTYRPSKEYVGGFSLAAGGGASMSAGFAKRLEGFGSAFKKKVKRYYTANVSMASICETVPRKENFVDLDPEVKDVYGLPVPRIHFGWGRNEEVMHRHMLEVIDEIAHAAGITLTDKRPGALGWSLHNVGTARMGSNPRDSVLNQFCQSHEIPNLFVVDGSCFVSSGYVNPTITILAIGLRSADYMIEEHRRGNLRKRANKS
ncbi:MAG: GMC family oxidoreductase [Acidobacteriota bacterium]